MFIHYKRGMIFEKHTLLDSISITVNMPCCLNLGGILAKLCSWFLARLIEVFSRLDLRFCLIYLKVILLFSCKRLNKCFLVQNFTGFCISQFLLSMSLQGDGLKGLSLELYVS